MVTREGQGLFFEQRAKPYFHEDPPIYNKDLEILYYIVHYYYTSSNFQERI